MTISDVETNELLRIIRLPVPQRPMGRRRGPWSQFQRFLAEEGLKPPRNGRPVGSAPTAAWYKLYRRWFEQYSTQSKPIPPRQFAIFLARAKFYRNCRDKKNYQDIRLIGSSYETASKLRAFLAENPLTPEDNWIYNPERHWRHPKRRKETP